MKTMKIGFVLSIVILSVLALALVSANMMGTTNKGNGVITKIMTRDCDREGNSVTCLKNKEITIERTKENMTRMMSKNISVTFNGEIQIGDDNKTYLKWDNSTREVKIMPDTASERAIERLGIKVCNESNNCTIELKDVGIRNGTGNMTKMKYVMHAMKERHFLWWHWNKQVQVEVDAETGQVSN